MLIILSLIFLNSAFAEDLTWQDCLKEVLNKNPELVTAQKSVQASESQVKAARSNYFPQLSASLEYARGNSSGITDDQYLASLNASQNIFNGLQDQTRLRQSRADQRSAELALVNAEAKIRNDLVVAFEGLIYAEDFRKMIQEAVHRREENLKLVTLRFESGRENKGSVLLSQANLGQAKFDELQASHALEVAQSQLLKVLGRESESQIQRSGNIPIETPPPQPPNFQDLATQTPDYQLAVTKEMSAQAAVALSKGAFYPSLNLVGSVGKQGPDFFPKSDRWSVGLNLSFPLFDGFKDYYLVQAAQSQYTGAEKTVQTTSLQSLVTLKQKYISWVEAAQKQLVDEAFVKAAKVRAEIARNKYNNSLQTFEEWDQIENDLILREKNFLGSQRDRVLAEASWFQAQGKGLQ